MKHLIPLLFLAGCGATTHSLEPGHTPSASRAIDEAYWGYRDHGNGQFTACSPCGDANGQPVTENMPF